MTNTKLKVEDFRIPKAVDDHDRKLLSDIEQFDCHIVNVLAEQNSPTYSFSVGLYYKYGHPEILVMGLTHSTETQLINIAASQIAQGKVFKQGERTSELAVGFECSFVSILVDYYEKYLGYGIWFYRSLNHPFPAIQLIWPDKQNRLPWETDYDQRFMKLQHRLDIL